VLQFPPLRQAANRFSLSLVRRLVKEGHLSKGDGLFFDKKVGSLVKSVGSSRILVISVYFLQKHINLFNSCL